MSVKLTFRGLLGICVVMSVGSSFAEETMHAEGGRINILFIGNSFSFRHDLPKLVKTVFEEGRPGLTVHTQLIGYGGQNLFTHWTYFKSRTFLEMSTVTDETIRNRMAQIQETLALNELPPEYVNYPASLGRNTRMVPLETFKRALVSAEKRHEQLLRTNPRTKWDYVVLQSWQDESADPDKGYAHWAKKFVDIAEQQGTRVILYITAPFAQNAVPVDGPLLEDQVDLSLKVARQLADNIDAYAVVPVPLAINRIQQGGTELTFRYENDFHPNQTTAFLTANMFYAAFFNESTEGFSFDTVVETKLDEEGRDPDGGDASVVFDEATRSYLQKTAFESVQSFNRSPGQAR